VNRAARSINTLCALLVAGGGLAAVAGWVLHIEMLTRLNNAFIPTYFNSALCFVLYGLGLLALNWQWRWIGRLLAGAMFLIGFLDLFEHVTGLDSGIDTLTHYYRAGPNIYHPGRMATAMSIAITSLGGALLLFSHQGWNERKSAAVAMLGSIAAAVGLGGFLSFAAQLQSTTGWVGFTQIGFPSAALCLLAGTNILLNVSSRVNAGTMWLPIPLGTGLLALLLTLTQALSADQDAGFSQRVQTAAWDLEGEAETQMHDMFTAIDRMAHRWDLGGRTDAQVWNGDAAAYFLAYPGLNALVWGDATGKIGRISSLTPEAVGGRSLGDRMALSARGREAARDALKTGKAQVSRTVTLRDGQLGFLYINPVTDKGAPDGTLLAAISLKRFFANVLRQSGDPGYVMSVEEDGRTIFSNAAASPSVVDARWMR
jgi:sensor domain CHASE-containing protein